MGQTSFESASHRYIEAPKADLTIRKITVNRTLECPRQGTKNEGKYSQQENFLHTGVDFRANIGLNMANKNDQRET